MRFVERLLISLSRPVRATRSGQEIVTDCRIISASGNVYILDLRQSVAEVITQDHDRVRFLWPRQLRRRCGAKAKQRSGQRVQKPVYCVFMGRRVVAHVFPHRTVSQELIGYQSNNPQRLCDVTRARKVRAVSPLT